MAQSVEIKRDRLGAIGQPDDRFIDGIEGGDSLNWTAHYNYLSGDKDVAQFKRIFECEGHKGLYVRHPSPDQTWYGFGAYCEGNWKGCESRDQMTGKLCYFAKVGANWALDDCFRAHLKRFLLFATNTIHNGTDPSKYKFKLTKLFSERQEPKNGPQWFKAPDLTVFEIWAIYIRGYMSNVLYPLLWLFDLQIFLSAWGTYRSQGTDVISIIIKCLLAQDVRPTLFSWLAMKFIKTKTMRDKVTAYWIKRDQQGMVPLYIGRME